MSSGRLKALLFLPSFAYYRAFEALVADLLAAGHEVLVAVGHERGGHPPAGIDHVRLRRRDGMWRALAGATSRTLDYLRLLEPEHTDAVDGRERARERAPRGTRMLLAMPPFRWGFGRRTLAWMLRGVEAGIPLSRDVKTLISERGPHLILVAAAVEPGYVLAEYLRAAEAAEIPAVLVAATDDDAAGARALPRERVVTLAATGANGTNAGAARSTLDAIESAARKPAEPGRAGWIARPLLWLLTPLLLLAFVLFRPRGTITAVSRRRTERSRARARAAREEIRRHKAERANAKEARAAAKDSAAKKEKAPREGSPAGAEGAPGEGSKTPEQPRG